MLKKAKILNVHISIYWKEAKGVFLQATFQVGSAKWCLQHG